MILKNYLNNFCQKFIESLDEILIPFFVKNKMFYFLAILFMLNIFKIKRILPKGKIKYKAVVLQKLGGNEDLLSSEEKYNKEVLYYSCPRRFFKIIFETVIIKNHLLHDYKYLINDKDIINSKKKLQIFLEKFLDKLKEKIKIDAIINFNFCYKAERELQAASSKSQIRFIVLHKEGVNTPSEKLVTREIYAKHIGRFEGHSIAVYSEQEKKNILDAKIINKNRIKVIGCARADKCFQYKKITPKNQIIYYTIDPLRGSPLRFLKIHSKKFREKFSSLNKNISSINWKKIHDKVIKILITFAKENKDIEILIKEKDGFLQKKNDNLPENCRYVFGGTGEKLLKNAKIIIGLNTTALLETIAANRFIILPLFNFKNNLYKKNFILDLRLSNKSCALDERDFVRKLRYFKNTKFKKNSEYNNKYSLKSLLGNINGRSSKKLNEFLTQSFQ
jgi:hypothetical protein